MTTSRLGIAADLHSLILTSVYLGQQWICHVCVCVCVCFCAVWDLIVSLSLQPIGLGRMSQMENTDQLSTKWFRLSFLWSNMPNGGHCWFAFHLKQDVKMSPLYENIELLRTDLKLTLLLLWTPPCALFTMLCCMTETVIFALCDSSHFEGDLVSIKSPVHDVNLNINLFFVFSFMADFYLI